VASVLFNGASSRVLVRDARGGEIAVALPQTGEFAGLGAGVPVDLALLPGSAVCFASAR
jgi:hypothetical protein